MLIGAGWLGKPLALKLQELNYQVKASKTSQLGAEQLTLLGIDSMVCELPTSPFEHQFNLLVEALEEFQPDTLIGCFPPRFRQGMKDQYAKWWRSVVEACVAAKVPKIIMVSATSVYPDEAKLMREEDATLDLSRANSKFSDSAKVMLQAEQALLDADIEHVVIRCAGLFGPDRHPARFLSKLKQVSQQTTANMLHLDDAIGVCLFAIEHLHNDTVNACSPFKVTKAEFYSEALRDSGLAIPFPPLSNEPAKTICSKKLVKLGYHFHYRSALDAFRTPNG